MREERRASSHRQERHREQEDPENDLAAVAVGRNRGQAGQRENGDAQPECAGPGIVMLAVAQEANARQHHNTSAEQPGRPFGQHLVRGNLGFADEVSRGIRPWQAQPLKQL